MEKWQLLAETRNISEEDQNTTEVAIDHL